VGSLFGSKVNGLCHLLRAVALIEKTLVVLKTATALNLISEPKSQLDRYLDLSNNWIQLSNCSSRLWRNPERQGICTGVLLLEVQVETCGFAFLRRNPPSTSKPSGHSWILCQLFLKRRKIRNPSWSRAINVPQEFSDHPRSYGAFCAVFIQEDL